jgi:hypothetical protein
MIVITQNELKVEHLKIKESVREEHKPNQQLCYEKTREYSENSITYSKENYVDNLPRKDDHYIISRNEHISRPRTMSHLPVRKDSETICYKWPHTYLYIHVHRSHRPISSIIQTQDYLPYLPRRQRTHNKGIKEACQGTVQTHRCNA